MLNWEPITDENGNEGRHIVRLSTEAYEELLAFAKAIETQMRPGGDFEYCTDWAGKAAGAAARIAGVLHGIKNAHGNPWPWEVLVTVETMKAACDIMSVIGVHSRAALDLMGADQSIADAKKVWEWVQRQRLPRFTIREAFQALKGSFPRVDALKNALEALEERGYISLPDDTKFAEKRCGPGRPPSPTVLVRPELTRAWG